MELRSSRTFPGQVWASSARRSSGVTSGTSIPYWRRQRAQEVLGDQHHVVAALAQRGEVDGDHAQAVVQVLAELAALDRPRQVHVRGGDDAHVHLRARTAPTGAPPSPPAPSGSSPAA
jgi:hypothetical protein